MANDLRFGWELSGSGWATCRIQDDEAVWKTSVSYCTDALADILHAVAGLYGPASVQRVSFDLEPAEARWILSRRGPDIDMAIRLFADMSTSFDRPDQDGTLVWRSTQPRALVGHAVLEAARSVLGLHGEDGYLKKWGRHPFPVAALQDLRRLHRRHDSCALGHDMAVP